jgi:hypothetical protein
LSLFGFVISLYFFLTGTGMGARLFLPSPFPNPF